MLIDDVTIKIKAGKGGDGAIAFNKNMMTLGPTGASGGRGGSIFLEGVSDLSALQQFRNKKNIEATSGRNGRSQFRDGEDGKDTVLRVPVGTVIHYINNEKPVFEITKIGERVRVAKGGVGGRGNFHFRSSIRTTPKVAENGRSGEEHAIRLELKLIADVGLMGLPNAGKSTLLNTLTKANAKTANYPFTTLEPNLGTYYDLIIADIPGLIEGASRGKGLGTKFLRHIERTIVLFHLISAESEDPRRDYETIRGELKAYNPSLLEKTEYVFLTKSDIDDGDEQEKLKILKRRNANARPLSVLRPETVTDVKKILNLLIKNKKMHE